MQYRTTSGPNRADGEALPVNPDWRIERDRTDKAIETLRARAALGGFTLHVISDSNGGAQFLVTRWNLSRTLPDVAAVEAFFQQVGVSNG